MSPHIGAGHGYRLHEPHGTRGPAALAPRRTATGRTARLIFHDTPGRGTSMTQTTDQDVVDLLLAQHQQIKALFSEVARASGAAKQDRFNELVRLLAVHESAEEQVVHPAARQRDDQAEAVVVERLREESEAKEELAALYDLGVDHPDFDARLRALASAVTAHATHEEQEEFSRLREELAPDRLRRMAQAVKAAEAIAPTRPHPKAGESATANLLAGPPLAVFDRARDAVRDWASRDRKD
jgi:hemerythrin superfamily protein